MVKFYDWNRTLSFFNKEREQALLTMVVGGNGIGKTYGLRKWLVKRYLETGERFCEICRHSSDELPSIAKGWFDKLEALDEFHEHCFKVESLTGYVAKRYDSEGNELESPEWEVCGYFVALTQYELAKRTTYVNVRYCVFDEFILDRSKPYTRYLSNEHSLLMKMCVAVFREIPGDGIPRRIIMMANAVDMINPYFQHYGIDRAPSYGYHWYDDKHVLLHYVKPWDAAERKEQTTIGILTSGKAEQAQMFDNVMYGSGTDFIRKKPSSAACSCAITFESATFGVWRDAKGNIYICKKTVKDVPVFALTTKDNAINYTMAKKSEPTLKAIQNLFYMGKVFYESPALRGRFERVMQFMGVR